MKIKFALLMLFLLTVSAKTFAEYSQEIELQDGTILVGYISRQQPGSCIVFHTKKVLKDTKHLFTKKDRDYTIRWKDVKYIRRISSNEKSWADDKLTLKSGVEYIGQIEVQEIGVSLSIRINSTQDIVVVKYADLEKTEKIRKEYGEDIWFSRPYNNRIKLRDRSIHTGLIVLQYMGDTANDNYIELLTSKGNRERIYMPDIQEYFVDLRK